MARAGGSRLDKTGESLCDLRPAFRLFLLASLLCLFGMANGLANPTATAFTPDGRLFVAQQDCALRVIRNGVLLTQRRRVEMAFPAMQ